MATSELNVKLTADESSLVRATSNAAKSLEDLKAGIDKIDDEQIDLSPKLELDRINRDLANLGRALDGLERRKAQPDVGMDITQLLKDEAKVRKAMDQLDQRKVEIEATFTVEQTSFTNLHNAVGELSGLGATAGLTNLVGGLGAASRAIGAFGGVAAGAAVPIAAVGGAVGGLVYAGAKLGMLAADVETLRLQLDILTDNQGGPLLEDLQQFAAETPFALDQVSAAARRLIVAGEGLDTLPDTLTELGDAAAGTGVPLDELASIFAQMSSKGTVQAEEMMQLAERGVPAWQALADSMGLTVAEVQELATQGKLGADAIKELQTALGEEFSGAMALQAQSLNGQLSTLNDNIKQTGQNLGVWSLPAMRKGAAGLNVLATAAEMATHNLADMRETSDLAFEGIMDALSVPEFIDPFDDAIRSAETFSDTVSGLGDVMADALRGPELGDTFAGFFEDAERTAEQALAGMQVDALIDVHTRLNVLIDREQMLDDLRSQLKGEDAVTLPAKLALTATGISRLGPEQLSFIETFANSLAAEAQRGLDEGLSSARIGRNLENLSAQLKPILVGAGLEPGVADRILNNLSGEAIVDVVADTTAADEEVWTFVNGVPVKKVDVDALTGEARAEINELTKPETKTITVMVKRLGTDLGDLFGPDDRRAPSGRAAVGPIGPGLLAAAQTMGAPTEDPWFSPTKSGARGRGAAEPAPEPTRLAPRQTPVVVHNYLDGREIGNRMQSTRVTGPSRARRRA